MKKLWIIFVLLLSVALTGCDKDPDDQTPVIPPAEKQVEIIINFGPIPADFQHEGGISVYGIGLFKNDASSEVAKLAYAYPMTKSVLSGDSYNQYLGKKMYVFVGVIRSLEGCGQFDYSCFWNTHIYVLIDVLKEKNVVYVNFPAEHQEMVIGKP